MTQRAIARQLANESLDRGEPLEWFETLYSQADGDESVIPWADQCVNPNLQSWCERWPQHGKGRRALVVGCGLGDDAELLQSLGFDTVAFDISQTAIAWCKRRFSKSKVQYCVADLFNLPEAWQRSFDFVLEIYTLQVLPVELRQQAMETIASCVSQNGTLLIITRGRDETNDPGQMPWPLVRVELHHFESCGLTEMKFEDYFDAEEPPVRRFRAEYRRSS